MANALLRALSGFRASSRLWQSVIGSSVTAKRTSYREEPDDYGPGGFHRINEGDKVIKDTRF